MSNRNAIPPRTLAPSEAARLLMSKLHLVFLGVTDIEKHRWLFDELTIALPGECALLRVEANWRWTADRIPRCVIYPVVDKGERAFMMMFVPDSREARLAAALAARLLSRESILATLDRLPTEAPILMLDDPCQPGNPALRDGYTTVCAVLKSISEGCAIDLSLN